MFYDFWRYLEWTKRINLAVESEIVNSIHLVNSINSRDKFTLKGSTSHHSPIIALANKYIKIFEPWLYNFKIQRSVMTALLTYFLGVILSSYIY